MTYSFELPYPGYDFEIGGPKGRAPGGVRVGFTVPTLPNGTGYERLTAYLDYLDTAASEPISGGVIRVTVRDPTDKSAGSQYQHALAFLGGTPTAQWTASPIAGRAFAIELNTNNGPDPLLAPPADPIAYSQAYWDFVKDASAINQPWTWEVFTFWNEPFSGQFWDPLRLAEFDTYCGYMYVDRDELIASGDVSKPSLSTAAYGSLGLAGIKRILSTSSRNDYRNHLLAMEGIERAPTAVSFHDYDTEIGKVSSFQWPDDFRGLLSGILTDYAPPKFYLDESNEFAGRNEPDGRPEFDNHRIAVYRLAQVAALLEVTPMFDGALHFHALDTIGTHIVPGTGGTGGDAGTDFGKILKTGAPKPVCLADRMVVKMTEYEVLSVTRSPRDHVADTGPPHSMHVMATRSQGGRGRCGYIMFVSHARNRNNHTDQDRMFTNLLEAEGFDQDALDPYTSELQDYLGYAAANPSVGAGDSWATFNTNTGGVFAAQEDLFEQAKYYVQRMCDPAVGYYNSGTTCSVKFAGAPPTHVVRAWLFDSTHSVPQTDSRTDPNFVATYAYGGLNPGDPMTYTQWINEEDPGVPGVKIHDAADRLSLLDHVALQEPYEIPSADWSSYFNFQGDTLNLTDSGLGAHSALILEVAYPRKGGGGGWRRRRKNLKRKLIQRRSD